MLLTQEHAWLWNHMCKTNNNCCTIHSIPFINHSQHFHPTFTTALFTSATSNHFFINPVHPQHRISIANINWGTFLILSAIKHFFQLWGREHGHGLHKLWTYGTGHHNKNIYWGGYKNGSILNYNCIHYNFTDTGQNNVHMWIGCIDIHLDLIWIMMVTDSPCDTTRPL